MIRVGVHGASGRIGSAVCRAAEADPNLELELVAKVGRGERSQPSATEYQLKNVGGVITRILASGEIIVINRAGQVVLHLIP